MRRILTGTVVLCLAAAANAATVGEAQPFADGAVDGWSGISVLDGYGGLPAGDAVTAVNYYASPGRADGNHSVQPIIAENAGGNWSIWAVGPVDTPAAGGDYSIPWSTAAIPSNGNTYHPGFWQWNAGVDDADGGLVPFGDGTGSGMIQHNEDGTSYVPAIGNALTAQHASGAGGRAYQINFETAAAAARFCDTSTADFCFDFDANDEGAMVYGDGEIRAEGGFDGGYLKVTDAANGQRGKVVLPDTGAGGQFVFGGRTGGANSAHHIDNLEASIVDGRVEISAMLRVGGGTADPADGFSFNFVRPGDPTLAENTDGWAGIATEPENLPEEGTTTGISIGFDEWQSGPSAADTGNYDVDDIIGMSLRLDGQLVGQTANLTTKNGALDDVTSLQTGENADNLGWAQLTISAPLDGANLSNVQVTWKGAPVAFVPEPSSSLLAAVLALSALGLVRRRRK
ncbi:MAG: hypothetical protein KDB27_15325 [Planctomycetales bacterium]|nr:hypothetical protein [Planctomycetales bacterium]